MSFLSKNLKNLKTHFWVKFGARVKIKLRIIFKTIDFIYPENLTGQCLDHERSKFCQCKGQEGDKVEATWPRGLLPI